MQLEPVTQHGPGQLPTDIAEADEADRRLTGNERRRHAVSRAGLTAATSAAGACAAMPVSFT